jgi:hypothetical protein
LLITATWLWTLRIAAVALALLSGWLLGRAPPDWRGDDEPVGGGSYGMPGYYDAPMTVRGMGCFAGSWGAGLASLAACLLFYFTWPDEFGSDDRSDISDSDSLLFSVNCWALIGAWAIGWIASRLTDKGPVGPLE